MGIAALHKGASAAENAGPKQRGRPGAGPASDVQGPHRHLGVAGPSRDPLWRRLLDLHQLIGCQGDAEGLGVLLEARAALRARDRHDVLAAREEPGERELGRRTTLRRRVGGSRDTSMKGQGQRFTALPR
jgi:hypothetical protein